ncbi:hypothetical protein ARMSODRAFT_1026387 [Armillaria solidipes]|uniref:F-box domain-containing protein n=1 Tax=Armillaria solidipes TaxID=1076256 RepID=A0A2H3APA8_9AGAR|nr:hypothetical protein ARMSODRAFT_1026387 [Armillaria solidipes]
MANFEDLHDDVLILIIQFVRYRQCPSSQRLPPNIAPLTRTCRRLRGLCFSIVFTKVAWTWVNPSHEVPLFPPTSICCFIRELDIAIIECPPGMVKYSYCQGRDNLRDVKDYLAVISDMIATVALSMHAVHTVRFKFEDIGLGPWPTLLESIFLLPALESLTINAPWTSRAEAFSSFTPRYAHLRRFIYHAPFFHSPETAGYEIERGSEQINVEVHNLRLILNSNRGSLEAFELPGELADDLLDSPFPSLKELFLLGYASDPFQLHCALTRALLPVSHIQTLQIETASNNTFPLRSQMTSALTRGNIARLRSLTLSNPLPSDPFFSILPPSLEHLSLTSYPDPFPLPGNPKSRIPVDITSCYALKTILASGSFTNLRSLNISYRWESNQVESSLFSLIPQVSPYLELLELNRYAWKGDPFDVVSLLETSLRSLNYLSHLRLNLESTAGDSYNLFAAMDDENRRAIVMQSIQKLAISVASLRNISRLVPVFQAVSPMRLAVPKWTWRKWEISRVDGSTDVNVRVL